MSANQNDERKEWIHIADDFAARACVVFDPLTKTHAQNLLSLRPPRLCSFSALMKLNLGIDKDVGNSQRSSPTFAAELVTE
jgi:hypothetical protein